MVNASILELVENKRNVIQNRSKILNDQAMRIMDRVQSGSLRDHNQIRLMLVYMTSLNDEIIDAQNYLHGLEAAGQFTDGQQGELRKAVPLTNHYSAKGGIADIRNILRKRG